MKIYPEKVKLIEFESIDSTNTYLKNNIDLIEENDSVIVVSSIQTKGRGQRDNKWYSADKEGLYFSIGKKTEINESFEYLPHMVGVSIIECLKNITLSDDFRIKEPNDIFFKNKKLAGILIENIVKGKDMFLIIGIGINVNNNIENFPREIKNIATSLKNIFNKKFDKEKILNCLIIKILENLNMLINDKNGIIQKYNMYLM